MEKLTNQLWKFPQKEQYKEGDNLAAGENMVEQGEKYGRAGGKYGQSRGKKWSSGTGTFINQRLETTGNTAKSDPFSKAKTFCVPIGTYYMEKV